MRSTPGSTSSVETLLVASRLGNHDARNQLLDLAYEKLRKLAQRQLAKERPNHTLRVTDLVHEVCGKLLRRAAPYEGDSHLLAIAALAMKQVLQDHERRRKAQRRDPGRLERLTLCLGEPTASNWEASEFLDLLECFSREHSRQAKVVEMRFLAGMNEEEIAGSLAVSSRTVRSDWRFARAWLKERLEAHDGKQSNE